MQSKNTEKSAKELVSELHKKLDYELNTDPSSIAQLAIATALIELTTTLEERLNRLGTLINGLRQD